MDFMGIILGLLIVTAMSLAWRATRSTGSPFDLEDLLLDQKTGKASLAKLGQFTALSVSTWSFVYCTLHGTLTEFYFGTYMAAWAGTNLANKWIDQRNRNSEKDNERV